MLIIKKGLDFDLDHILPILFQMYYFFETKKTKFDTFPFTCKFIVQYRYISMTLNIPEENGQNPQMWAMWACGTALLLTLTVLVWRTPISVFTMSSFCFKTTSLSTSSR